MTQTEPPFTEPPWSSDVAGIIYAVNALPGRSTVATLQPSAPAAVLAAAPELLRALQESMPCLEEQFGRLPPSALRNAVLEARNVADAAIIRATVAGYPASEARERPWTVNPQLPAPEQKANARLLDAASDLRRAVKKAHAALAGHTDNAAVAEALRELITRTMD